MNDQPKDEKPKGDKTKKERLDVLLVNLAMVSTRARAQAMILAGHVLVNDVPITKAGERVHVYAQIRLREAELKYVSRGALKLRRALEHFKLNVSGKTCIDIGASTGGFTEVLLESGAARVYAIDVGTNQLAWKIRNDQRVISRENCNARYLEPKDFEHAPEMLVMDVSFISIRLLLPALSKILKNGSTCVVLFKPQFELGKGWVGEGGIVRDQEKAKAVLSDTLVWAKTYGYQEAETIDSPIQGTDGNHEYLIQWTKI